MIKKIKENWLILFFLFLLIVFISLRISLLFNKDTSPTNQTNVIPANTSPTDEPKTFEIDPDRDDILEEMPVLTFDISEFVPYETDQFKITSLDTNKLFVSAKVDAETAKKSFNDFLKQYISEDSQKTFEVIWQ